MEQGAIETLYDRNLASLLVGFALAEGPAEIRAGAGDIVVGGGDAVLFGLGRCGLDVLALLPLVSQAGCRSAVVAANLGDAEDGLPWLRWLAVLGRVWGRVAKSCAGQGAFGPAVADVSKVPIDLVRGGVFVKLIADVDQMLHRCNIHVVDRREVKDNGLERWLVRMCDQRLPAAWSWVIPGAILQTSHQYFTDCDGESTCINLRLGGDRNLGWFVESP